MRAVADTNIIVSALLWRGSPHQLFQAINDDLVAFYTSRVLPGASPVTATMTT